MKPQLSAMLFFLAGQGVMVSDGRGRGLEGCGLKTDAGNHFRILLGDGFDSMRYLKRCRPCLLEGTSKKHFVIFFFHPSAETCLPSGKNFSIIIRNTNHDPCRYLNRHSWSSGRYFFDACHSTFLMNLFRITDCTSQINNLIDKNYELKAFLEVYSGSFQRRT